MSTATKRKIRVVVAKPGLDGHDRGAKIIARALRDAGMEVIYTGLHQTPEQIVETVIQEDADAVGLSILSGAHMTLVPRVVELLKEQGIDDVLVTVGGTIPSDDIPQLKELGVAEVFTPGAPTQAIIDFIQGAVPAVLVTRRLTRLTRQSIGQVPSPTSEFAPLGGLESEDLRSGQGGPGRRRRQADQPVRRGAWTALARGT